MDKTNKEWFENIIFRIWYHKLFYRFFWKLIKSVQKSNIRKIIIKWYFFQIIVIFLNPVSFFVYNIFETTFTKNSTESNDQHQNFALTNVIIIKRVKLHRFFFHFKNQCVNKPFSGVLISVHIRTMLKSANDHKRW